MISEQAVVGCLQQPGWHKDKALHRERLARGCVWASVSETCNTVADEKLGRSLALSLQNTSPLWSLEWKLWTRKVKQSPSLGRTWLKGPIIQKTPLIPQGGLIQSWLLSWPLRQPAVLQLHSWYEVPLRRSGTLPPSAVLNWAGSLSAPVLRSPLRKRETRALSVWSREP